IIGDDDSGLCEQMGWRDLPEDMFGQFNLGLDEGFRGAIREVDADFQRWRSSPTPRGARVCFKYNHALG
ncbi:MAG TPA: hypothetical protein VNZ25_05695, partial [Candidatus Angelobacter sp.]|nr:hypothetical protein [Candidatus Angelobacter sp.]